MGLMAAASNVIPLGLLYMRPLQWWLKIRGVFLKGNLFCMIKVTRRCLRALGMWRQPRFLSQGAGSYLLPCNASDGDAPHRLGSSHGWPPCLLSPSHVAHQLARDVGHVSSTETLLPRPKRSPCVGAHRQHSSGLLHKLPRMSVFMPPVQASVPDPWVVPGQTLLAERRSHSWVSQYGSRHPLEAGAEARGMDASPRGGEVDLESVWPGTGGPLRYSGDSAMSPLVLSDSTSSTGAGCHGTDMAEASSVRFSPGSSGESAPGRDQFTSRNTILAGQSMVLGPDFSPRRLSMGDSHQEGSPLTGGGLSLQPGDVEVVGVAPEGTKLIASDLSTEVFETILQPRAPSGNCTP